MSKINMIETEEGWLRLSEAEYEVFKLGEKQGRADGADDGIEKFVKRAKKSIRKEISNAYKYGISELDFVMYRDGKPLISSKPFETSAEYIICMLESLAEQIKKGK